MELQQRLNAVTSCIVTGERQSGKLVLMQALIQEQAIPRVSVISAFGKESAGSRLEQFAQALAGRGKSRVDGCLYARSGWREQKREIGFTYLIDDLQQAIIRTPSEVVLLHRIDEFFEVQDRVHIELFFSALTAAARDHGKKLLMTLQSDDAQHLYTEQIERYMDLQLDISRDDAQPSLRRMRVLYSSVPLFQSDYHLQRETQSDCRIFPVVEGSNGETGATSRILLVTENPRCQQLMEYLVKSSQYRLIVVTPDTGKIVEHLMARPELIILEAQEREARDLMRIAKNNMLKVLRVHHGSYLRKAERLEAAQKGYFDLLPSEFFLEDLILVLERALSGKLYNIGLDSIESFGDAQVSREEFERQVRLFLEADLYFTVFTFRVPSLNSAADLNELAGRSHDRIWFDEDNQLLKFFAPNMLAHNAGLISARVQALDSMAVLQSAREAPEYDLNEADAELTEVLCVP